MMPSDYKALDGSSAILDLDAVYDIVGGQSGKRPMWSALIVFDPESKGFVELRSSPPDIRGGGAGEAEAVTDDYVAAEFGLSPDQVSAARGSPAAWTFIDYPVRLNGS